MSQALEGFQPAHTYLVCVDSDGCAMDTMDYKHERAFCPELIRVFGLEAHSAYCTPLWEKINLRSATRGINRFKGALMAFEQLEAEKGIAVPGIEEIRDWVLHTRELSNPALEAEVQRTGSAALGKLLEWSRAVNAVIASLTGMDHPFPGVSETLAAVREQADTAVVSSANAEALRDEWGRHGLAAYMDVLLGQEVGPKAACIAAILKKGYAADRVLMVGDALGDLEAAQKNGVLFYPILVGQEKESWEKLREEALPRFFSGSYRGGYEQSRIQAQKEILN
ncbi:MAG: HAD family hydrolase [Provencibacterium sp.]|nr:HAD family hydrolase [Provencibacterium sp.]